MSVNEYSVILNIGSKGAKLIGKTKLLFDFFSLPKDDYQYSKDSPFH